MPELVLTPAQNGDHLTVRVGDELVVSLPEGGSTGYRWTVASLDTKRLRMESEKYEPGSRAVGSAGTAVLRIRTTAPGSTRLELKKARPWESSTSAVEHFAVDLDIKNT